MTRRNAPILLAFCAVVGSWSCLSPARLLGQQPAPPRWKGTVDLTIGGENAVDGAEFGRVSGLAVDATGRIFVADADDSQVRLFSGNGALVAKIGRSGSGPLEFKRLATITIGPDRLLWTRDEGNARMLAIDVSKLPATSAKNVPLQQFTGGSRLPITFDPSGALIDESIWFDPSITSFRPLRMRRSLSGAVQRIDTLIIPAGAFAGVHKVTKVQKDAAGKQIGMSQGYMWQPYGPQWLRAYGPGGLRADAVGSRYEVQIYGPAGQLIRTLKRVVTPVPLSSREKRIADSTLSAEKSDLPFGVPAAKPPVIGLLWSQDGNLWVERSTEDGRSREADVYDASGRYIAIAEWPRTLDLLLGYPAIRGRVVHAVVTDASDLERIVRLQFR